ncbi:MAG: hypothetical protein FWC11_03075 [Firmicutes bacterium]|nr:hypothetical protein [Bacillota bacterium]
MKDNHFGDHGFEDLEKWAYSQDDMKKKQNKKSFLAIDFRFDDQRRANKKVMEIAEEMSADYQNEKERQMSEISDETPYSNTGTYSMVPNFDEASDEDGVINASGS